MSGPSLTSAFTSGLLLQLAVVFVTVNWAEEIAWMGFFQARLQGRHRAALAAVMTGPVFAFGHISQLVEDSLAATLSLLALMVVICIPFRALLAWLYTAPAASSSSHWSTQPPTRPPPAASSGPDCSTACTPGKATEAWSSRYWPSSDWWCSLPPVADLDCRPSLRHPDPYARRYHNTRQVGGGLITPTTSWAALVR